MRDIEGLRGAYKYIFSFPREEKLLAMCITEVAAWLALSIPLPQVFSWRRALLYVCFTALYIAILIRLTGGLLNVKRGLGFGVIALSYGLFYDALSTPSPSSLTPPMLLLVMFLAFAEGGFCTILSFALAITSAFVDAVWFGKRTMLVVTLGYTLALIALRASVNSSVERVTGVRGVDLLKGLLRYLLQEDKGRFEELLERASRVRRLPVHIYVLEGAGEKGCIVVPEVHPGPFRDLGSSPLPQYIARELEARGFKPLILKGLCGHGEDLVSTSEALSLARRIAERASNIRCSGRVSGARKVSVGGLEALKLCFENAPALLVVSPGRDYDDIPREIAVEGTVISEAHNSANVAGPTCLEELRAAVEEAARTPCSEGRWRVGFSRLKADELELEVGGGGVMATVFLSGDKGAFIVSFDSNNMAPGLREEILRAITSSLPLSYGEVATTDTHVFSGLIPGVEYYPVGSRPRTRKKALALALRAVKEALSGAEEVRVGYARLEFTVRCIDGEALYDLSTITEKYAKASLILLSLLGLAALAAPLIPF